MKDLLEDQTSVNTSTPTISISRGSKCLTNNDTIYSLHWKLLLLLSHFSRVQLCATP